MIYKKFQIKICFIYQDIHIYLKYFDLFHKNNKICDLEPGAHDYKKRHYNKNKMHIMILY